VRVRTVRPLTLAGLSLHFPLTVAVADSRRSSADPVARRADTVTRVARVGSVPVVVHSLSTHRVVARRRATGGVGVGVGITSGTAVGVTAPEAADAGDDPAALTAVEVNT
jgi:hypothetical protein